jgi:hypothetical protein
MLEQDPLDLLKNWAKAADCMQRHFVQISRRRVCPEATRVAPDRLACCLLKWREQESRLQRGRA